MEGRIVGAWLSPDRTRIIIQVDDEELLEIDARAEITEMIEGVDHVPLDWESLGMMINFAFWSNLTGGVE